MTLRFPSRARYLILLSMISLFLSGCVCKLVVDWECPTTCDEHKASQLVTVDLRGEMEELKKQCPFKHSLMLYEYRDIRGTYYACNCDQASDDAEAMINKIDKLLKEGCQ